MSIESFQDANTPAAFYENITLRRSQVLDNWGDSHSQGIYATGILGLTIGRPPSPARHGPPARCPA